MRPVCWAIGVAIVFGLVNIEVHGADSERGELLPQGSQNDYTVPSHWRNPRIAGEPFWYISKYLELPTLDPVWNYYCKAAQQTGFWDINNGYTLVWGNFLEDPKNKQYLQYFPVLKKMVIDKKKAYITSYSRTMSPGKQLTPLYQIPDSYKKLSSNNADFYLGDWVSEWGYAFRSMVLSSNSYYKEWHKICYDIFKSKYGHEPKTRDDVIKLVPIFYEVYSGYTNKTNPPAALALDDGFLWPMHHAAEYGARTLMLENRRAETSPEPILAAFTRGAARQYDKRYGYWYGSETNYSRNTHYTHQDYAPGARISKTRLNMQKANAGLLYPSLSFERRMMLHTYLSGGAFAYDENFWGRYSDMDRDGEFELSPYGRVIYDFLQFTKDHPDPGVPYTPVGLLLDWSDNWRPVMWPGSMAWKDWYLFMPNDGRNMTEELISKVIFPLKYDWPRSATLTERTMLGATPYGAIFDVLRPNPPSGVTSLEKLKAYKILFLIGDVKMSKQLADRLGEYTRQGGTLVINQKQLGGFFPAHVLGVKLSKRVMTARKVVYRPDGKTFRCAPFEFPKATATTAKTIYDDGKGHPLVVKHKLGKGNIILTLPPYLLQKEKLPYPGNRARTVIPHLGFVPHLVRQLTKNATPFTLEGKNVEKQLMYLINRKDNGWVLTLMNNWGIEHDEEKMSYVDDRQAVNVTVKYRGEVKDAWEWTTRRGMAWRYERGENVFEIEVPAGDVRILELQSELIKPVVVERPRNLALDKPVTASADPSPHAGDKHAAENVVDGNVEHTNGYWSDLHCPQWVQIDLGEIKTVDTAWVLMFWSKRPSEVLRLYQYYVEASEDGKTWKRVLDESKNMEPATKHGLRRTFDPVKARYIRCTVTFNSMRTGAQIIEIGVSGPEKEKVKINRAS